jgi:ABC-2 type transport system permease protein
MRNAWIICKKELHSYFVSPIACLLFTFFALLFGYFFWTGVYSFVYLGMESQMRGEMFPVSVNEFLLRNLVGNLNVIGLFFFPLITMRLFAEEKRSGTIELLATSPVHDTEIVLGKWLAALLLYGAMLLFTALNYIWLFKYGNPDWKPLAIAYLGLLLQAGALLAVGTFISTLTRNQIIAAVATFGVCLLLYVFAWVGEFEFTTWARVVSYLSVLSHFETFSKGVLYTKDVIFYVSLIFLGLFLTSRSLESLRWRA